MKIALVAPNTGHITAFWLGLIEALKLAGHDLHVLAPLDNDEDRENKKKIEALGCTFKAIPLYRFIHPLRDLKLLLTLYRLYKQEQYDLISNFTVKPNVFSAIAAKLAGCPRIVDMVLGLGMVFSTRGSIKFTALRSILSALYKVGFTCCTKVCFVNNDDRDEALRRKLVNPSKAIVIKSGIGVDLEKFCNGQVSADERTAIRNEINASDTTPIVIMMARLFWGKGIREFFDAYHLLKDKFPDVHFVLVGPHDVGSLESIPQDYLDDNLSNRLHWLGWRTDVRELLSTCDIFVLPSYYGEGLPQVLLEAMAFGKPLVSTDNVGCREAVEDNKNGYLIPTRNSDALADALAKLLTNTELREEFGRYSRQKAEREFGKKDIIQRLFNEFYEFQ